MTTLETSTIIPDDTSYISERAASFLSTRVFNNLAGVGLENLNKIAHEEHEISFEGATRFVVCKREGSLVGFASIVDYDTEVGKIARIANIVVEPDTEIRGIGTEIETSIISSSQIIACETINPILVQATIKAAKRVDEESKGNTVTIWGNALISMEGLDDGEISEIMKRAREIRTELFQIIRKEREDLTPDADPIDETTFIEQGYVPTPEGMNIDAVPQDLQKLPNKIKQVYDDLQRFSKVSGQDHYGVLITMRV